jgi:hypothetical protein
LNFELFHFDICASITDKKKRRQAFPMHIYNEDEVTVNINEQFLEIYLRACSICANETYEV